MTFEEFFIKATGFESGPFALGYGAHFGLGLFVPETEIGQSKI